jgi:hypothetical protein
VALVPVGTPTPVPAHGHCVGVQCCLEGASGAALHDHGNNRGADAGTRDAATGFALAERQDSTSTDAKIGVVFQ